MRGKTVEQYKEELIGERFGSLTVVGHFGAINRRQFWECLCDCGKTTKIRTDTFYGKHLPRSCGCKTKEIMSAAITKHGLSKTPEYRNYVSMLARCYNGKSCVSFGRYAGKGITVCERWRESFENFLEDMGKRPSKEHSIDRIDNNGDYCPANCRWATKKEQALNREKTTVIVLDGVSDSLRGHSKRYGISQAALKRRLEAGFPLEMAKAKKRYGKYSLQKFRNGIGTDEPAFNNEETA